MGHNKAGTNRKKRLKRRRLEQDKQTPSKLYAEILKYCETETVMIDLPAETRNVQYKTPVRDEETVSLRPNLLAEIRNVYIPKMIILYGANTMIEYGTNKIWDSTSRRENLE